MDLIMVMHLIVSIVIHFLSEPFWALVVQFLTTDDGSTYTYSGWGLSVVGGYGWYFENDISVLLGIGPSIWKFKQRK